MNLIFEENRNENVIDGKEFEKKIKFMKVPNLNRLKDEHKELTYKMTEKIDGTNIAVNKIGNDLVFYSRNKILRRQNLGKKLSRVVDGFNWKKVYDSMDEGETIYLEFYGNHIEFNYDHFGTYGFMIFAKRNTDGKLTDKIDEIVQNTDIKRVPVIKECKLPSVEELRVLLDQEKEGYVYTHITEDGEYIIYKAKRRDLLEEATEEEQAEILASAESPENKIAKIVCTKAKVKHILAKINDRGEWDDTNSVLGQLSEEVIADVWEESEDLIEKLPVEAPKKKIDRAIDERVRKVFFDMTLKDALRRE
jgi:hypothetical protein